MATRAGSCERIWQEEAARLQAAVRCGRLGPRSARAGRRWVRRAAVKWGTEGRAHGALRFAVGGGTDEVAAALGGWRQQVVAVEWPGTDLEEGAAAAR